MNAVADTPAVPEVQEIEASLDALLTAITRHDASRAGRPHGRSKAWSMSELAAEFETNQARTPAGRFAHGLADDPVRYALTYAVRRLGERLHEIGGVNAMVDACDRVAELDPSSWGKRMSIMDARWDGIGRTRTSPGWCS